MKTVLTCLAMLVSLTPAVQAQDHLAPDASAFVNLDEYEVKLRHVFAQAFEEGVILRALVVPSFQKEYVVGIRVKGEITEAFVLEPSSSVWDTEIVRLREKGEIKEMTRVGETVKEVPPEKSVSLKKLKERTPADYRNIKVTRRARPIDRGLADDIKALWTTMLLDVRHPEEPSVILDGIAYHFSAFVGGRGDISGTADNPDEDSRTGRLAALAKVLADFARGKVELKRLEAEWERAGKSIKP